MILSTAILIRGTDERRDEFLSASGACTDVQVSNALSVIPL